MKKVQILYRSILSLCLFFLMLSGIAQKNAKFVVKNYYPSDYKAYQYNHSTVTDKRGFVYFTNEGIIEYDGVEWRKIKVKHDKAFVLDTDSNGVIYVGGFNEFGYLTPNNIGTLQYKSISEELDSTKIDFGGIWEIKCLGDDIYFWSQNAIFRYNPKKNDQIKMFKAQSYFSLINGIGNKLYTSEVGKGLLTIENDEVKFIETIKPLKENFLQLIIPWKKNQLLIGSSSTLLYLFNPKTNIFKPFKTEVDEFIANNAINGYEKISNNRVLFHSVSGGAVVIDYAGRLINKLNIGTGLITNVVLDAHIESNSKIWINSDKGLSLLAYQRPIKYYDEKNGLGGNLFRISRLSNIIYIATSKGLLYYDFNTSNQFKKVQGINTLVHKVAIFKNNGTEKLIALTLEGVYEIVSNQAEKIVDLERNYVALQLENTNKIAVGYMGGIIILKYKNRKWIEEGRIDSINIAVDRVIEDHNNDFWFGTESNKMGRIIWGDKELKDKNNFEIRWYNEKNNIESGANYKFLKTKSKLFFFDQDKYFEFDKKSGKFINANALKNFTSSNEGRIFKMLPVENSNDIICTKQAKYGFYIKFLSQNENGFYIENPIEFKNIFDVNRISTIYSDGDSLLWYAVDEKLYKYTKSKQKNEGKEFKTFIRRILIGNDSVIFDGNIVDEKISKTSNASNFSKELSYTILYEYNSIKINFAAPFFENENLTEYSFKLEGYNNNWSNPERLTSKEYSNLYPGDYHFKVKAINIYGEESNIADFKIKILPPWYQKWWAYVIYLLILSLFIYVIVKLNSKRLIALNLRLENIIKERTQDVREKNAEIVAQNEELIQSREEIRAQRDNIEAKNIELEKLSIAMSNTDNAILIMDANGNFQWANQEFERLFGYSLDEHKRKFGDSMFNASTNPQIDEIYQKCIKSRKSVIYESKAVHVSSGKVTWLQTTLTPILGKNDELKGLVAIDSDISKLKMATDKIKKQNLEILAQSQEIKKANVKLKRLDKFKEEITTMIVHDLKNPLNVIIGLTKDETVLQSGKQMLNMVLNMLDVQKYENTEIKLDKDKHNLRELSKSAQKQVHFLYKQKNIVVENFIGKFNVNVDSDIIVRVFVNVLTNAIKYTPNNGKITIESEKESEKEVVVKITDTGPGIPEDKMSKVFVKFEQVLAKKSGLARSTGIGLTFCKMFIEAHGCRIGVNTELGVGSTFWFTLPFKEQIDKVSVTEFEKNDDFLKLSSEDKEFLKPIQSELQNLQVYEFSDVEKLLSIIHQGNSDNLKVWKKEMENALYAMNQEKYLRLINMIN